jgi:hypothetical protein
MNLTMVKSYINQAHEITAITPQYIKFKLGDKSYVINKKCIFSSDNLPYFKSFDSKLTTEEFNDLSLEAIFKDDSLTLRIL